MVSDQYIIYLLRLHKDFQTLNLKVLKILNHIFRILLDLVFGTEDLYI